MSGSTGRSPAWRGSLSMRVATASGCTRLGFKSGKDKIGPIRRIRLISRMSCALPVASLWSCALPATDLMPGRGSGDVRGIPSAGRPCRCNRSERRSCPNTSTSKNRSSTNSPPSAGRSSTRATGSSPPTRRPACATSLPRMAPPRGLPRVRPRHQPHRRRHPLADRPPARRPALPDPAPAQPHPARSQRGDPGPFPQGPGRPQRDHRRERPGGAAHRLRPPRAQPVPRHQPVPHRHPRLREEQHHPRHRPLRERHPAGGDRGQDRRRQHRQPDARRLRAAAALSQRPPGDRWPPACGKGSRASSTPTSC